MGTQKSKPTREPFTSLRKPNTYCAKTQRNDHPPSYHQATRLQNYSLPRRNSSEPEPARSPSATEATKETTITASSIPQWRWTTDQCQQWLFCILTEYCCMPEDQAYCKAYKFYGFGPNLWRWTEDNWVAFLGEHGGAVFDLLSEMYKLEGTVPENIRYEHFEARRIKGKGLETREAIQARGKKIMNQYMRSLGEFQRAVEEMDR